MNDEKKYDERYQISINCEEQVTEDIEVLKLGKFILQKNRVEMMYEIRN